MTDECKMCAARREAMANGTWTCGFRVCPHCAAPWQRGRRVPSNPAVDRMRRDALLAFLRATHG